MDAPPCQCTEPGACPRYPLTMPVMHGGPYMKCRGIECSAEESAAYRELFDKREAEARAGKRPAQKSESTVAVEFPVREMCRHFTDSPITRGSCGTCQQKWVYPCDLHGQATPSGWHDGVTRCADCGLHRGLTDERPDAAFERLVLHSEHCPGDVVVMSAALESLHRAHPGKYMTVVSGTASDLFVNHPRAAHFNDRMPEPLNWQEMSRDKDGPIEWRGTAKVDGADVPWRKINMRYPLVDLCDARPVHFMHGYCEWLEARLGVRVPLAVNRPVLHLSPEEVGWLPQVQEITGKPVRYWLVNAGFKDDYPAKWWGASNYQRVVDLLRGRVLFVQIGESGHSHPPLSGVIDLRGKTDTRQLMRLVHHAAGGVGPSTFLQHLCAAMDRPYVCLAGGREPLAWQHYPKQATLCTIGVTSCTASRAGRSCWKDRAVPSRERPQSSVCELPTLTAASEWVTGCLASITPERVAEEIARRYANGTATL